MPNRNPFEEIANERRLQRERAIQDLAEVIARMILGINVTKADKTKEEEEEEHKKWGW